VEFGSKTERKLREGQVENKSRKPWNWIAISINQQFMFRLHQSV